MQQDHLRNIYVIVTCHKGHIADASRAAGKYARGQIHIPFAAQQTPQDNGEQQISKNNQQHAWQYIFDIKKILDIATHSDHGTA